MAMVRKLGNSLGLCIPVQFVKSLNLKANDSVKIIEMDGGLLIKPERKKSFSEVITPCINTKGWKFDREEANERR